MTTTNSTETVELPMGSGNIIFEFSFSPDNPLSPPYIPSSPPTLDIDATELEDEGLTLQTQNDSTSELPFPYVQCLVYRSEYPENYFLWSGTLEVSPPVSFELTYDDGQNINGEFWQYQNLSFGQYYVFFDVEYGIDAEYHYEGNMAQIPSPTT
jgi:hypothetical protein